MSRLGHESCLTTFCILVRAVLDNSWNVSIPQHSPSNILSCPTAPCVPSICSPGLSSSAVSALFHSHLPTLRRNSHYRWLLALGSADSFSKGSLHCYYCPQRIHRQYVNKGTWFCSNKALLTNQLTNNQTGRMPASAPK